MYTLRPCAAVCYHTVGVFISLFLPSSAESALCVVALDPELNHVRCTKRNCEKCDEVAFRSQNHHMKVFFSPPAIMTTLVLVQASRMCFEKEKQIFNTKAKRKRSKKINKTFGAQPVHQSRNPLLYRERLYSQELDLETCYLHIVGLTDVRKKKSCIFSFLPFS